MIKEIRIENYKSIHQLTLELGRVTVLIGENGSGKSNILEAIALASAASGDKLGQEFLVPRGIRVTEPQFMRSAFKQESMDKAIKINLEGNGDLGYQCILQNDNKPYSKWKVDNIVNTVNTVSDFHAQNFFIYSPEYTVLRNLAEEGPIQPLGTKGEGLFKLLTVFNLDEQKEKLNEIKELLLLFDWFTDFEIPPGLFTGERRIQISDRHLAEGLAYPDQRSANEGFLFLLFYFALFVCDETISDDTPKFFAIDDIEASLNPKLCWRLIKELVGLAKKYDKQVVVTTHNPGILDGLNLNDDEQRLLVVYRDNVGHTQVERVFKPKLLPGQEPVRLSTAFLRGSIGGLPKNF